MNNNPIEELRRMETPVTKEEWTSIVNDRRYTRKFGRKSGLSPKGRAALIAGVAAVLITVPILVKMLSDSPKETVQTPASTSKTVAVPTATETAIQPSATETHANPRAQETTTPARVTTTEMAATHEGSTMASVTTMRPQISASQSRDNGSPILSPETGGSRLTYDELKTTPARKDTTGHRSAQDIRIVHSSSPSFTGNPSVCETTVSVDGQVTTKYEYSPEESPAETEQFFIPSAFTPNGDGLNDLFLVKANFVPGSFEMTILNRGGDAMFQTRDMNIGWDGHLHGKILPQGVYVCIIKYKDSQGNEHKQQGQVLLLP